MPHEFNWSFSRLKAYITCARAYHEIEVLGNYVKPETDAMRYGKDVHKALENYVKHGTPLPKFYEKYQPAVDALVALPGAAYTELEMALKRDLTLCDFNDPERWVRGVADFVKVDGDTAYSVDYKTGNDKYLDLRQLRLMALMIYTRFPEVRFIKSGLLFLAHNRFVPDSDRDREKDIDILWSNFTRDLDRLQYSYDNDHWPANPSGLCKKHCLVITCAHNGLNSF